MSDSQAPTVRRRRLAAELRRLRDATGLTREEVATRLEWSPAKVFRVETGRTRAHTNDIRLLLDMYGAGDDAREVLIQLARESRKRDWWHQYNDLLTGPFVGFEAEAKSLSSYHNEVVHGLLQTENYARALMDAAPGVRPEEVERRLQVRMSRQQLLTREQPPRLWCVMNESVLRRLVGGAEVMREQLDHLVRMSELPSVTVQVLPFSVGAHPAVSGAFTLLGFPEPTDLDLVYIEGSTSTLFLEQSDDVKRHTLIFHHLQAQGLSPEKSVALIRQVREELT